MDLRTTDTSSIAAKRIELDHVKPVKEKQHSFMHDRKATHAATETNEQAPKQKSRKEAGKEQGGEYADESETGLLDEVADQTTGGSDTSGHGEKHVLDIKV